MKGKSSSQARYLRNFPWEVVFKLEGEGVGREKGESREERETFSLFLVLNRGAVSLELSAAMSATTVPPLLGT